MFELHNETVKIAHCNTRTEKHGDDDTLALDIKCEFTTANGVLSKFSPTLKHALYTTDPGATADMLHPDHMPKLMHPLLGTLKWELELPSVQFRILHGEDDMLDTVFSGAKAGKFSLHCQEGGSVTVGFRIQVSEPDEALVARLLTMLGKSVKVTMINEAANPDDREDDDIVDASFTPAEPDLISQANAADEEGAQDPESTAVAPEPAEDYAALYSRAATFVRDLNRVSVSILVRGIKTDPEAASRILDDLESAKIIGPAEGRGMHDVLEKAAA